MKKMFVHLWWLLALCMLMALLPTRAALLIPVRTDVAGFPGWTDDNVAGTTYLQLLVAGASTTTPTMDFSAYTQLQLDFKARSYGGTNSIENSITIAYTSDNGANWVTLGTRTPASATMTAMESFDLSSIRSSQVKLRFSVAGTINSIGAGIDDISVTGFVGLPYTLTLSKEGSGYATGVFPYTAYSGASVNLPILAGEGDWKFEGWDANPAVQAKPAYAGGAAYITTEANVTLYAIYSRTDRSAENWTKITATEHIIPGVYVITNGDFFLPNALVVNGPEQRTLLAANVFAHSGKLQGRITDEMRWNLSGVSTATTIQSTANSAYLFNNDLSDGVNVGATAANWAFEAYESGFAMKDATYNRYCAVYTAGTDWRSYTTRNFSSYKTNAGILDLYRLTGSSTTTYSTMTNTTSWTGAVSSSWNASSNWSNGIPSADKLAIITDLSTFPEISSSGSAASVVVRPAARLSILNGGSLTVSGNFTLQSSIAGTATLINQGVLTVSGNSTVEQVLTTRSSITAKNHWWYISTPVSGATSGLILQHESGNKMGFYHEPTADYPQLTATGALLEAGRGYLAEINIPGIYKFTGTLNNGSISPLSLTRSATAGSSRGFNLIGNPYPSFIDWNALTAYGTSLQRTDIRPTIWLRTRSAAGTMVFDTFDGEIGTSLGVRGSATQFIAPLQAFWVKVATDNTSPVIHFTPSICNHRTASTGAPQLRAQQDANEAVVTRQMLKLELRSGEHRDETIICTKQDALDGYDFYDSDKMSSGNAEIFTLVEGRELVINRMQGLYNGVIIPLGFRPVTEGAFSIRVAEMTNIDSLSIYLTDHQLGTEVSLQGTESYNFNSDEQPVNNRFSIVLRSNGVFTETDAPERGRMQVLTGPDNTITVITHQAYGEVNLHDLAGKLIVSQPLTSCCTRIETPLEPGVYIVTVNNQHQKISISKP